MNPIDKFNEWYANEVKQSSVKIPSACCLTSIGLDGYPNSRFVSLKEVLGNKFIITGPIQSRKGKELLKNPKAALTFWWPYTKRQIRIQGDALQIEDNLADQYFRIRNKDSQIVSQISKQGKDIDNIDLLIELFKSKKNELKSMKVERPYDWSGFYIFPKRIEFMQFSKSRFHLRELYIIEGNDWQKVYLQP